MTDYVLAKLEERAEKIRQSQDSTMMPRSTATLLADLISHLREERAETEEPLWFCKDASGQPVRGCFGHGKRTPCHAEAVNEAMAAAVAAEREKWVNTVNDLAKAYPGEPPRPDLPCDKCSKPLDARWTLHGSFRFCQACKPFKTSGKGAVREHPASVAAASSTATSRAADGQTEPRISPTAAADVEAMVDQAIRGLEQSDVLPGGTYKPGMRMLLVDWVTRLLAHEARRAREEALSEAAVLCDDVRSRFDDDDGRSYNTGAQMCAGRIRALLADGEGEKK